MKQPNTSIKLFLVMFVVLSIIPPRIVNAQKAIIASSPIGSVFLHPGANRFDTQLDTQLPNETKITKDTTGKIVATNTVPEVEETESSALFIPPLVIGGIIFSLFVFLFSVLTNIRGVK